jgi:hypothetical protein
VILFRYFRIADQPPRPPRNALTELNDRIVLKSPIERSEYVHLAWWVAVLQERKSCGARKWLSGAPGDGGHFRMENPLHTLEYLLHRAWILAISLGTPVAPTSLFARPGSYSADM